MAKTITLLAAVNQVLKRKSIIQSDLSTLTDSGKQVKIDNAVSAVNDVLRQFAKTGDGESVRGELAESTFTLTAGDRDYALASNAVTIEGDPVDRTNGHRLTRYPGGYIALHTAQLIPGDYTGLPSSYVIDTDDEIYLDAVPTSAEAGRVYTYPYRKAISLTAAADLFPVDDEVIRSLYPSMAEWFSKLDRQQMDKEIFAGGMAVAAQFQNGRRRSWGNRKAGAGAAWPEN